MNPIDQRGQRDGQDLVTAALACVRCGGSLQWSFLHGPCGHCGLPVRVTLNQPPLSDEHPAVLENLRMGARGIVFVALASVAVGIVCFAMGMVLFGRDGQDAKRIFTSPLFSIFSAIYGLAITVAQFMVYQRLTGPGLMPSELDASQSLPSTVRKFVAASVVISVFSVPIMLLESVTKPGGLMTALQYILGVTGWLLHVGLEWSTLRFIRPLAARMPDAGLAGRIRVYVWLVPLLSTVGIVVCVGPVVGSILYLLTLWQFQAGVQRTLIGLQWGQPPR